MHPPPSLSALAVIAGFVILGGILAEGFETIVLPRTVTRQLRLTRLFYAWTWSITSRLARRIPADGGRELFLSYFGPLSLPLLLGWWAIGLIVSFALLQWAQGPGGVTGSDGGPLHALGNALYGSGVTFFTLGYGDVIPRTGLSRLVAVTEAGLGFGFLAVVIGYLPVLYQAFSRREAAISRLDGRASSPATAGELIRRYHAAGAMSDLPSWLRDWEVWASELLESHLSYPVLTYYRSQHDHQSWLGAITVVMDTCALLLAWPQGGEEWEASARWQARLTFAMARHAIIDLAYIFNTPPMTPEPSRLSQDRLESLQLSFQEAGLPFSRDPEDEAMLRRLRATYEPYVYALAHYLIYDLPPWYADTPTQDNWETSAWEHGPKNKDDVHFR